MGRRRPAGSAVFVTLRLKEVAQVNIRSLALGVALLQSTSWAVAQQSAFTLEQVMSSTFPTELTAAPHGGAIAWVFNAQGVRNIWAAEAPAYKAHPVTPYTDDDGQEIAELAWTPDGRSLVYVRGGDFETGRSEPNPRSFPQGVEQDIWIVGLSGGAPRKLAEGHSPTVSPQGDRVAYILKDQVWMVKLAGNEKPVQLIHSKGQAEDLHWSPDGSKLGFVSEREDHAFIGVYDFAAQTVRYLDPGVDHDTAFEWSPDSRQIAFIRVPYSSQAYIFGPHRTGQPWSIRVADAATGQGREIWKADEGTGSVFHGVEADRQLYWCEGDRIVFPWERTGWLHLYSIPASGGQATLLTPGDFEVDHVTQTRDRRTIVYSSNQDDIDRRHIWRVSPAGGAPVPITRGTGLEWTPVVASDHRTIAVLRSDPKWPARPALVAAGGELRDLAPQAMPADFPADRLVVPQQVILSAADGLKIHGQLFLPQSHGGRHPAVVFFHGGSRRQMLLGWHYMGYYHNAYAMNQYLASRGFVVLSVNYRSGIGYGMEFREALNYGAAGASEYNDVQGAGLYLRGRPDVDPDRIGLWGGSYGGYLTALGLARSSSLFKAGVDFHGVHDWNTEIRNWLPSYRPDADPNAARIAWEASPLASLKTWRSPVLLIQGDDDRNVPFEETIRLAEALRQQGVQFQLLVFPDEIHDFLLHRSWLAAYHATAEFLEHHLRQ
jgi:dipeptidyl aminopeptidase/acylaminoacyl peptidase